MYIYIYIYILVICINKHTLYIDRSFQLIPSKHSENCRQGSTGIHQNSKILQALEIMDANEARSNVRRQNVDEACCRRSEHPARSTSCFFMWKPRLLCVAGFWNITEYSVYCIYIYNGSTSMFLTVEGKLTWQFAMEDSCFHWSPGFIVQAVFWSVVLGSTIPKLRALLKTGDGRRGRAQWYGNIEDDSSICWWSTWAYRILSIGHLCSYIYIHTHVCIHIYICIFINIKRTQEHKIVPVCKSRHFDFWPFVYSYSRPARLLNLPMLLGDAVF